MNSKKRMLFFFGVVTLFSMVCSFAHPVTPSLFKQLHLADYMFGVALAVMQLGNMLFSPFWAKISKRSSSRRTLLISSLGYGAGQLLFSQSKTVLQVILIRFLTGIFVGGIFVSMLAYVVNVSENESERKKNLILMATLEGVFNAIGYFIGGMLGEIGVIFSVVVQAICLAVCAVLFYLVCVEDRQILPEGGGDNRIDRVFIRECNPFSVLVNGRILLKGMLGLMLGIAALQYFGQTCFDQSFNYYVIDQIGLSTGYNGAIKGVMGLVTLLANSTICVWLMKKTKLTRSLVYLLFICGVVILASLAVNALAPYLVLNILFYASSCISVPMIQDLTTTWGKKHTGDSNLVVGYYNAMKNLGGILGALLAGFTYIVTPKTPFLCCAASFFLAAAMAMICDRKGRRSSAAD